MTNEEILKKAIEKVVQNGYLKDERQLFLDTLGHPIAYEALIFSHKFAKAFWGEGWNFYSSFTEVPDVYRGLVDWKYHLKQMVVEEDPIKYLEKFLDEPTS